MASMARPTVHERIDGMLRESRRQRSLDRWMIWTYLLTGFALLLLPRVDDPEGILAWTYVGMGVFLALLILRGDRKRRGGHRRASPSN
jgi:hypothetical protein